MLVSHPPTYYLGEALLMLRFLESNEKERLQRRGYMCEHLLCLYSMVSDRTALFGETFPVFLNPYDEADVILFGLGDKQEDKRECVLELAKLPIKTLNIVSPVALQKLDAKIEYEDWDYHINVKRFDFNLRGNKCKHIRYITRQMEKTGYEIKIGREFTPNHTYILSRHLSRHTFDVWDFEELLSLERFFREHKHGYMMEVYKNDKLMGFDVIDAFEENGIMVVPLGIYLDVQRISDFLMYENLKHAKDNGYEWLDVGPTCGDVGIRSFKQKWFAEPKYKIYVQKMTKNIR